MGTKNYNLTYWNNDNPIDIVGDIGKSLDEIDIVVAGVQDDLEIGLTNIRAKFPVTTANISSGAVTSDKIADGAVTSDKIADGAVTLETLGLVDNSLPGSKLRDGSVTAEKLSSTGIDALLAGITVRHFDSTDSSADNTGMDIVSGIEVSGWYVPIWGLLVIPRLNKAPNSGSWPLDSSDAGIGVSLPSYIPKPSKDINVGYAIRFTDDTDFKAWAYMTYTTDGRLKPSTSNDSDGYITNPLVFFIRSNGNTASLNAYNHNNGVV